MDPDDRDTTAPTLRAIAAYTRQKAELYETTHRSLGPMPGVTDADALRAQVLRTHATDLDRWAMNLERHEAPPAQGVPECPGCGRSPTDDPCSTCGRRNP